MQRTEVFAGQAEKIALGLQEAGIGHGVTRVPVVVENVRVHHPALDRMAGATAQGHRVGVYFCDTVGRWTAVRPKNYEGDQAALSDYNEFDLQPECEIPPVDGYFDLIARASTNGSNHVFAVAFVPAGTGRSRAFDYFPSRRRTQTAAASR